MRTPEELNSKEFRADLSVLSAKLTEAGIEHVYRDHPVVKLEPQTLAILGYFPTGTHQILIGKGEHLGEDCISIIRGMCSFGDFELYGGKFNAERFQSEEEVINALKEKPL